MGRQRANINQGPPHGGRAESDPEELRVPPSALTEERIWWTMDIYPLANLH